MRAICIAVVMAISGPALADEIYPATGAVLPPKPSVFVEGTPELVLNVTSNDRLVPYTVVPTEMAGIVRVDIELESGPLRIGQDGKSTLAEYLVAEAMPHRLARRRELGMKSGYAIEMTTDAALFRLEWPDGSVTAKASTESIMMVEPAPARVVAMWSDRTEAVVLDNRPRACGLASLHAPGAASPTSRSLTTGLTIGLLALLAALALVLQRRVSRDSLVS